MASMVAAATSAAVSLPDLITLFTRAAYSSANGFFAGSEVGLFIAVFGLGLDLGQSALVRRNDGRSWPKAS
jgi:hypothetical protein